jgi:hypothetical protein
VPPRPTTSSAPGSLTRFSLTLADALHIHPISKLVQLRPSLGYLDDLDKKKRTEEARRKRRGAGGDDDSGDEDDDDLEDGGVGKKKGAGAGGDELKSVTVSLLGERL